MYRFHFISIFVIVINLLFEYVSLNDELFLNHHQLENSKRPSSLNFTMHNDIAEDEKMILNKITIFLRDGKLNEGKIENTTANHKIELEVTKEFFDVLGKNNEEFEKHDASHNIDDNNKNKTIKEIFKITSFSVWDDIVAAGLWVALFIIFGPTSIIVLLVYVCCKNVVLRGNPSQLLT